MRIRSRLLILVFAVLVPAVLAAALVVAYVYNEQHAAYRKSIQDFSRAMAQVLDKEMSEREMMLRTLAESPALTRGDFASFYEHAHALAQTRETTIILSDLSGQQFLNTRVPLGTTGLPKSGALMALRQRYGTDATIVSDVYFAPIGKSTSFGIQMPVKRNGALLYYISMGSFTSQLQLFMKQDHMPESWIGSVFDRNGMAAARSVDPEKFVGKLASEGLRKALKERTEGIHNGISSFSNVPVTAVFSRAPKSEWSFVVSVPRSEQQKTAIRVTSIIVAISLLLLGVGVGLAFLIARQTTNSMEALRLSAVNLARGEPVQVKPSGILEIDAVGREAASASEQIRHAKAELEHRVAAAVTATERSQRALLQAQKLEALGRLTGGIAHDFNNVLQTLTTGLHVAQLLANEPRAKNARASCERAVRRAGELTRQLSAFGRVQDAHLVTVDLARQIDEISTMLEGSLRGDIALRFDIADDIWPVTLDPLQFELALLNLCINARAAMPAGGTLTLTLRNFSQAAHSDALAAGEYARLAVSDSGLGMEPEVLAKALDPFFTTKPVGQGSGMGLPQAYGFARQAGGNLTIDSTIGVGTTVTLYLPRSTHDVALQGAGGVGPTSGPASGRVLFVEDDALVSEVVGPALEAAGFTVLLAKNADEALGMLQAGEKVDVIFSDVVMPGKLSGIDLAQIILAQFPGVRVLLATGYSERRVSIPGVRILAKPYAVAEVVDALNRMNGSEKGQNIAPS